MKDYGSKMEHNMKKALTPKHEHVIGMHHNPNKHSHRDKLKTHHRMFKDL
jgi:hypothetical protein